MFAFLEPLKCFISLISINKKFFCFLIYFGQYFHLLVFSSTLKLHAIPNFFSGIICSPLWGPFVDLGSFAVQFGDHLRSGIIYNLGIICGAVQDQTKRAHLEKNYGYRRFWIHPGLQNMTWSRRICSHFIDLTSTSALLITVKICPKIWADQEWPPDQ